MIDTDVERGTFFPPEMRIVRVGNDFRFIYPINPDEYPKAIGYKVFIEIDDDDSDSIDEVVHVLKDWPQSVILPNMPTSKMVFRYFGNQPDSEFVRQVKTKLGIVEPEAYL